MPVIPPSQGEIHQYLDAARDEIAKFGPAAPQSILWHYTSGDGLIGIIGSGEFWVTQVSCVNDATEIRYSRLLLRQALIEKRQNSNAGDDETVLYDTAIDALSTNITPLSEWFIGCLSAEDDDLSQWRAYGGGEGGYAIAFDTALLLHCLSLDGNLLAQVCYNENIHRRIALSVADSTVDFYLRGLAARPGADRKEWTGAFLTEWAKAIGYVAPAIKHPGFKREREWRLLRQLRDFDLPRLKFRQRQSMLARHLPLALRNRTLAVDNGLLPIVGVCVGPSRHQEISRVSVADLLRAKGYSEQVYKNVSVSAVPFQAF